VTGSDRFEDQTGRPSGNGAGRPAAVSWSGTVGELFCGPGGLGYGLVRAGIRPLWGVDNDPDACATYEENVGAHAVCSDIEDVNFLDLAPPDGLAFGFPCNDFSIVGEQRGVQGYYGGLFREAERALGAVAPDWFIAENVLGILQNGGARIMARFADAGPGYRVSVHMYEFERYGVPQRRHRVIGVGVRQDYGAVFRPPAPTHDDPITSQEALRGVEDVSLNSERTRHPKHVVERLRHIPEGENAWHPDVPEHLRLNVESCRLSIIYRRLHRDEPAYTVTGSGGGGTHMYHFEEPRALTNRERARLQTFPDDFAFCGSKEAVRRQIGMAVPPLVAEHIGRALIKTLEGEPYPSVDPSVGIVESGHSETAQLALLP